MPNLAMDPQPGTGVPLGPIEKIGRYANVIRAADQKVIFFGCPLDPDEKHDAIEEKLSHPWHDGRIDDPLLPVVDLLARDLAPGQWSFGGAIDVPGWLRPVPPPGDRAAVAAERMVEFIDKGGCRDFSDHVRDFVRTEILPDFPCLIAVDHSLTGGAFEAISQHYGPGEVSLVVIDSHTDAVPMSKLSEAIFYDIETNPNSVYDRADPLLYDRAESYSASSFLHHLVADGTVAPRDLYILGVSDYPGKKALRIKDPRIAGYVAAYTDLKKAGATIVTKKDCQMKPSKVKSLLNKIRTPYVYLSVDMDIGSRNALDGVRFRNWQGLSESQLLRLVSTVWKAGGSELQLVGMDLTEFDPRRAGQPLETGQDATYRVAAGLVRQFAFGLPPHAAKQAHRRDESG